MRDNSDGHPMSLPTAEMTEFWGSEALKNYIANRKPERVKEGNFAARERSETAGASRRGRKKFERRLNGAVAASFAAAE